MAQSLLQNQVQKYLKEKLLPISDQSNEDGIFPEKVFHDFFQAGFGASFMPEQWGGDGDFLNYLKTAEEMGRIDAWKIGFL